METIALILVSLGLLWSVYWAILRPVLLAIVRDDLDTLKAEAEWAIIEGKDGAESKAAHLLDFSDIETEGTCSISLSQFLLVAWLKRREFKAENERRQKLVADSPVWIREVRCKFIWLVLRAALINSPVWWFFLPPILLASQLSINVYVWWNDMQNHIADTAQTKSRQKAQVC